LQATSHIRQTAVPDDDENGAGRDLDACHIKGRYIIHKISGNLHIIAGKAISGFPFGGHGHVQFMSFNAARGGGGAIIIGAPQAVNFSHRITHLSFGTPVAGMVHPLDGESKIAIADSMMFQYFLKVIPTEVDTSRGRVAQTFQLAVTEQTRAVDHHHGSHGIPGIFIRYDFSPLAIAVKERPRPLWQLAVRLCGIIGGVFATSGFLHIIAGFAVDLVACRLHWLQPLFNSKSSANGLINGAFASSPQ
jgi:hypothetical protein